ncbi:MAG TPA: hypothetical protein VFA48_11505 [Gammaproteobacteria bacterium]|nr:hypothetical protein [Gammaproteobacteria bacterium]
MDKPITVAELPALWRNQADEYPELSADGQINAQAVSAAVAVRLCADELEAALRAQETEQEPVGETTLSGDIDWNIDPVDLPVGTKLYTHPQPRKEWQPIETAPKDGTEILIWGPNYDFAPVAKWGEADCDDGLFSGWHLSGFHSPVCSCEDSFIGWQEDIDDGLMPTHWTPRPARTDAHGEEIGG